MNDQVRQNGSTSEMLFKIPALIAHVSSIMSLEVSFCFFPPPVRRNVSSVRGWRRFMGATYLT